MAHRFQEANHREAWRGTWPARVLALTLASLTVNCINGAHAQTPSGDQIATSSSCDPRAAPQIALPSTATGIYVPATRSAEATTPVAARYRAPNDWPWLCRYRAENQAALVLPRPDVVYFGDSITENWTKADPGFFGQKIINRGIGGQTSAQLLLRFYQDVVTLRPRTVHIMVGANDVAGNAGSLDEQSYKNNIQAMVDLARVHRIRVILGNIPPAIRFPWRTEMPWRSKIEPAIEIRALNLWLREFTADHRIPYLDYHAAMAAPDGSMIETLTLDGVHPNASGYEIMRKLAEPAVARTLRKGGG